VEDKSIGQLWDECPFWLKWVAAGFAAILVVKWLPGSSLLINLLGSIMHLVLLVLGLASLFGMVNEETAGALRELKSKLPEAIHFLSSSEEKDKEEVAS
jgi:hypothetical protein